MRKIAGTGFILLTAALLSSAGICTAEQSSKNHDTELGPVSVTPVITNLEYPWGMEMLPDGKILVTQREGTMVIVDPENRDEKKLVANVPPVWAQGQGGLLDIALDPDFDNNRLVYFTFSDPTGGNGAGTAIASAALELGDKPALRNTRILYSQENKTNAGQHFGSRIVFDRSGDIFFTIGDRGDGPRAQDPMDGAGSVLHITKTGEIPGNNPFADGKDALPQIWSTGHRNPQGAALHPETGELWTIAHGARGGDEINKPEAGKNYGWPEISYGTHYSGAKIGQGTKAEGLEQPLYYWDPSIAPSGLDFYTGDDIPQWKGNLFAGALKYQMLVRLELDGDKIIKEERLFEGEYGRVREVRMFPDGALWFMTDSDEGAIYRVTK